MKPTQDTSLRSSGTVKWFDASKGFGFLEVKGMDKEVLLHVSTLRDYGLGSVPKGAEVEFDYVTTNKGVRVTGVVGVLRDPSIYTAKMLSPEQVAQLEPACVKWFDTARGFGFVTLFGTNREVFLHSAVLQASEIEDAFPGLAVAVLIETDGDKSQVKRVFPWMTAGAAPCRNS